MKRLLLVVVTVLGVATLGVGGAPLGPETGGEQQAEIETGSPSAAIETTPPAQTGSTSERRVFNVLPLPSESIERSDLRRQHADLGPAAGFDTVGTTNQLVTRALAAELDATSSDADKQARIDDELDEIEADIDELESKERTAIREFSNDAIEPRELVVELARIHLDAAALRERIQVIDQHIDTDDEASTSDRLETIEYDLRMLKGPVRGYAVSVLRGDRSANRVMIETGNDEIVLSTIDDDEYVREVNRKGLRESGASNLTDERAGEITEQQYPTLWNRSNRENIGWNPDRTVYILSLLFEPGELRTFIDGPSEQTFIEHQRLPLEMVETGGSTNKVQDGLNVTVDQTYVGGPLRVTVTDADTGEPVEATVTIGQDGQESQLVGTANDDGVVWAISPRGAFTITVLGEGTAAAFVDIDPAPPESVTAAQ